MKFLENLIKNVKKNKNMINESFGLDISGGSVKALKLKANQTSKTLLIEKAHYVKLYDTIIQMGMIKDKTRVKLMLKDFFTDKNFGTSAILNVPEAQSFAATLKIDSVISQNQLKDIVLQEAQKEIPFPLKETYYDFRIVGQQNNTTEILFIAAPKVVLNDYIDILKQLSIEVKVFELEPLSSFRAIKKGIYKLNSSILIINIGFTLTNINIFENGSLKIIAYLPYGSEHIDEAISRKLQISNSQASNIRKTEGFKSNNRKLNQILTQEILRHIIENIKKLLGFYQNEKKLNTNLEKIVLVGGFAVTPGFDKFIENKLKKEALIFDPFAINKIEIPPQFAFLNDNKISFTQAVGLALRGLEKDYINEELNLLKNAAF